MPRSRLSSLQVLKISPRQFLCTGEACASLNSLAGSLAPAGSATNTISMAPPQLKNPGALDAAGLKMQMAPLDFRRAGPNWPGS